MNAHRVAHWLWNGRGPFAAAARGTLLPFAVVYGGVMRVRAHAYRRRWLQVRALPAPAIAVGNLAVGGAGKTPIAGWIARYCATRGRRAAILLRGYGADEVLVHERESPEAVVVADPDRVAGAARACAAGADVLVLDDAFQRLDVARDLNIVLVSAESVRRPRWTLPAGPWREDWGALARADLIVVTRKRAGPEDAAALVQRLATARPGTPVVVAHLGLGRFEGMHTRAVVTHDALRGRTAAVAAGVADPTTVAVQVRQSGAGVRLLAYPDHHAYGAEDVARLVRAAASVDYLIVTEKDAVKLRHQWPGDAREPLVAVLTVDWGAHEAEIGRCLDRVLALPARPPTT